MSRQRVQERQLKEVFVLVQTLTERMMTAYVVGSRPSEPEVMAFCRGVLLLEEHAIPLPHFAEDVIGRLQAQLDASSMKAPAPSHGHDTRTVSLIARLLRPLRLLRAA